ncbi:MAG: hypothetical protein HC892_01595 [Saprospiraceae bacterium]|nr:hypothetical protein [Saprospiraceae bacterium]
MSFENENANANGAFKKLLKNVAKKGISAVNKKLQQKPKPQPVVQPIASEPVAPLSMDSDTILGMKPMIAYGLGATLIIGIGVGFISL